MKYIRTITGKIIDVEKAVKRYKNNEDLDAITRDIAEAVVNGKTDDFEYYCWTKKESDTIEGLIMPEDLIEYDEIEYSRIEKARVDYFIGYDLEMIPKERITALYIRYDPVSEPNAKGWLLAARKTTKGRWKLI